jgi:hypothetical protein
MKKVYLLCTLLLCVTLTACKSKVDVSDTSERDRSTADSQSIKDDEHKVAMKLADLITVHCADKDYLVLGDEATLADQINVKFNDLPIDGEDNFLGIDARGEIVLAQKQKQSLSGRVFRQVHRRNGEWYVISNYGPIKVNELHHVQVNCSEVVR